jgi:carboxypeptidase Taq
MGKEVQNKINQLKELMKEREYLGSISSALYWDLAVKAPEKSVEYRSEMLGYVSAQMHRLETSEKMKELVDFFEGEVELSEIDKAMVRECKREYEKNVKIPEEKVKEFQIISAKSEAAWEEAKENSDFNIFKPHLEKVVGMCKEFIDYRGYEGNKYNTLLGDYERGITVEKLDSIFGELRDAIVDLLNKIRNSKAKVNESILEGEYPEKEQEEFSKFILNEMGYDFKAGRLDESVHPFTISLGRDDVRITTHYNKKDFKPAVFGCIHEGGHALYDQGIAKELQGTGLADGTSMGIHESQSLFYESVLATSEAFWNRYYKDFQEKFPRFKEISFDDFYKSINATKPSLIRIESDELTYCLHIIIRYEIEKALINDEIKVEDLPRIWNEKYKEYLGVEPSDDSEGVLQDMHWSDGSFGYFPSYALGRLYSAQFFNKMKQDNSDIIEHIENGNLKPVLEWLRENVHKHGAVYPPAELVMRVTGEELDAKYFIEYLREKYGKIYEL